MSLIFADGFDQHNLGNNWEAVGYKWDYCNQGSIGNDSPIPRGSDPNSKYYRMPNLGRGTHHVYLRKTFTPCLTNGSIVGSCIYNFDNRVSYDIFVDNNTNRLMYIRFEYDSPLQRYKIVCGYLDINDQYVVNTTPHGVIDKTIWEYLEFKLVYSTSSSATIDILVNGKNVLSIQANDIADCRNNIQMLQIENNVISDYYNSTDVRFDDIYICDVNGTDNNDFLGDISVKCLRPDGNGLINDFTPVGEPNNFECVNDFVLDEERYVEATDVDDTDLYTLENNRIPATATVLGVINNVYAKKTDSGNREIGHVIGSSTATHYDSGSTVLTTEYKAWLKVWDVNPLNNSPFTPADIEDLQCGFTIKV